MRNKNLIFLGEITIENFTNTVLRNTVKNSEKVKKIKLWYLIPHTHTKTVNAPTGPVFHKTGIISLVRYPIYSGHKHFI
jgi:hypothetical protein